MSVTCHKCGSGPAWLTTTKEETPYQIIYSVSCRRCGEFYQKTVLKKKHTREELGIGVPLVYPQFDCSVVGCTEKYSRVSPSKPKLPLCQKHAHRLRQWRDRGSTNAPPIQLIDGVWVELRPSNRTNITPYRKGIRKGKVVSVE